MLQCDISNDVRNNFIRRSFPGTTKMHCTYNALQLWDGEKRQHIYTGHSCIESTFRLYCAASVLGQTPHIEANSNNPSGKIASQHHMQSVSHPFYMPDKTASSWRSVQVDPHVLQ